MGTFSTIKKVATGTLVWVAVLSLLVLPSLAGAEDGWIAGTLRGGASDGPALVGATVVVLNTTFSATTDAEGKYNLSVPAGNHTLKVVATNYNDKTSPVLKVMANETVTYDAFLEKLKGSISGKITDSDDTLVPIANVQISADGTSYSATTDADGRYTIDLIEVGTYKFNVVPPAPYPAANFTTTIKASQNIVKDLKLKAPTVFLFTVKESGGKAILGATITVGNYSTTTDVDGIATLDVLPAAYVIKIQADGYKTAILDSTIAKGDLKAFPITLKKQTTGGGGGEFPVALAAGAAGAVVVVLVIVILVMRRKKAPAAGAAPGSPGGVESAAEPAAPGAPKTQAQKMKEWADFERMYGRPHPDAPGWVSAGAAAAAAPKPKCPRDGVTVTFEPFTGQYFCSKCDERYTAEQVFRKEDEVLEQSRPTEAKARAPGTEEPEKPASGDKLELSTAQPTWALEHGQTMTGEDYATQPGAAPAQTGPAAAPEGGSPPQAAPMEAAPVSDDEPVADAAPVATLPEGVNPEAGPLFSMPKPIDYTDLPPPPPPKEPPKQE